MWNLACEGRAELHGAALPMSLWYMMAVGHGSRATWLTAEHEQNGLARNLTGFLAYEQLARPLQKLYVTLGSA